MFRLTSGRLSAFTGRSERPLGYRYLLTERGLPRFSISRLKAASLIPVPPKANLSHPEPGRGSGIRWKQEFAPAPVLQHFGGSLSAERLSEASGSVGKPVADFRAENQCD